MKVDSQLHSMLQRLRSSLPPCYFWELNHYHSCCWESSSLHSICSQVQ